MPVPNKMADLSTLAASNSPSGSDAIGNSLDDYLRATQAIVRSTNAVSSAALASASTTDLGTADAESVTITGATTITSLGTSVAGLVRECRFSASLTITASTAIVLPGAASIITAANDVLVFRSLGSGNWTLVAWNRPQPFISDVIGLTAALAGKQASLGYTPVNKAGDTMSGNLLAQLNVNNFAGVTSQNQAATSAAFSGFYMGNDVNGSLAAYIAKNSSGNTQLGGVNSLNIVQNQAANFDLINTTGTRLRITAVGVVQPSGALQPSGEVGMPASAANAVFHTGGYASPIAGRTVFGDGTGYNYKWCRRVGSAYTDVMSLDDTGNFVAIGSGTFVGALSGLTVTATSDERLKDVIGVYEPRDLTGIDIYEFKWKSSGAYAVSPIAQKVRESAPEYVVELDNEDKTLTVDKAGLALERVAYLEGILRKAGLL